MRAYCLSKSGVEPKWVQYQQIEAHRPLLIYGYIFSKNKYGSDGGVFAYCAEVSLSQETGWEVKRVSLKARSTSAKPDMWEEKVLKDFDAQEATGKPVAKLIATSMKKGKFRLMKAQGVQPICLTCHGTNIQPEVRTALLKHYPNDQATGYKLGQVRGAFSLTKILAY